MNMFRKAGPAIARLGSAVSPAGGGGGNEFRLVDYYYVNGGGTLVLNPSIVVFEPGDLLFIFGCCNAFSEMSLTLGTDMPAWEESISLISPSGVNASFKVYTRKATGDEVGKSITVNNSIHRFIAVFRGAKVGPYQYWGQANPSGQTNFRFPTTAVGSIGLFLITGEGFTANGAGYLTSLIGPNSPTTRVVMSTTPIVSTSKLGGMTSWLATSASLAGGFIVRLELLPDV